MTLEHAASRLATGELVAAIDAMLEVWRVHRAPDLADLIDRATRLLPAFDRPLGTTIAEADEAWHAAIRDPAARAAAMPQLLQHLVLQSTWGRAPAEQRRLAALGKLADDPRIALRLAELSGWRRISADSTRFWRPLFAQLARIHDVRTRDALAAQVVVPITDYMEPHERLANELLGDFVRDPRSAFGDVSTWPPRVPADETPQLAAIAAHLERAEAATRVEWDLVAVITDDWRDDGPRMIYADWLIERGHPRGEYILLDTKRHRSGLTDGEAERYAELRAIPYLFGTLDDFSSTTARERDRGLDRELTTYRCAGTLGWRAVAHEPLLAIVETLRLDPQTVHPPAPDDFIRVLRAARSLDTVIGAPARLASAAVTALDGQFRIAGDRLIRRK
ncbi:MAG TPA: TIGR02996 domain-containing protein [Kofleriaceae bacterium]|nr:TIGR02996 domain-containing protein [Kofleriaceae bacterium]